MSAYPHVEKAEQYIEGVLGGKISVCKWVRLACQRQKDDRERWKKSGPYRFDKKKAERICNFIEAQPHTKGTWAAKRENIALEPWQCFILTAIFGWVDRDTDKRRFRVVYEEVPRKNGKSIKVAGVGHFMFTADGEYGAEVYSGATTEKQAWEVFRPARLMALRNSQFREYFGIDVNASNLVIEINGSRFEPIIGNPGDGSSPSCAIVDEYHEHKTSDLVDTMHTGMGAREQPLLYMITTAGDNLAGPCYSQRNYATKVLDGVIEDDELFAVIYTIDEGDDWDSLETLKKANPNYDVSIKADFLQARLKEARQNPRKQALFKTKYLNIWVGSRNAWMDMQAWARAPERQSLEELAGRPCFLGVDLASKKDIAAMMALFPPLEDNIWHLFGHYYLPEDAADNNSHYAGWANEGYMTLTPGNVTDYQYIMDDIRSFSSKFEVREIPYDPWNATHFATLMAEEGAPMVEFTLMPKWVSEPMKELEALVLDKKLAHGQCPVLTWMASNVTAKVDANDNIFPRKEQQEQKIDGIVATIMALARAKSHIQQKSVYESRGIRAI